MVVQLTPSELMQAAMAGVMRRLGAIKAQRRAAHGIDNPLHGWGADIEGACGEYAVAKALGVFWNGTIGRVDMPDVGALEVRTTSRTDGSLIVHEGDNDDAVFVLVTGAAGSYTIRGTILGGNAKLRKWWRTDTGRPAFFVPQSALLPLSQFRETYA